MRSLLLAFCLLLPLVLPARAETPPEASSDAPDPAARDAVVPEGIEGLTPDEIHLEALFAALDGEVVRYERLLEVAAERGSLLAAKDLVRLHRVRGAPDWRETAMRTLRPIPRAEPIDWEQLYWLAYAGERLDPPLPQAQTDLWYRLAAWQFMDDGSLPNRAHLQRVFAAFEEEQYLDEPVSERFRRLVSESLRLRRASGDTLYRTSRTICAADLEDAPLLCIEYLTAATRAGHVRAGYEVAVRVFDEPAEVRDTTLSWAVHKLCDAARENIEDARLRYAEAVLQYDFDPEYHRIRAYLLLHRLVATSPRAAEMHRALEARLTDQQRKWLALMASIGLAGPEC